MNTKVIVLGVGHSNQLVTKDCQPAAYRAYIDRIKPDVIGVERSPLEFNRSDFYEFTYEQQYIIVPYAKKNKIPLRPFDWLVNGEEQQLAWNINDIDQPPLIRGENTYKNFIFFDEAFMQEDEFFLSETDEVKLKMENWLTTANAGESDFPRRLFLYRTFMQAMRIKQIAKEYRGGTFLVVVGLMHKNDIDNILSEVPNIDLVQPSQFGYPTSQEIDENTEVSDLFAVLTFNLLGVQSNHFVDWDWMEHVSKSLERKTEGVELDLLKIRLGVLTNRIGSKEAVAQYEELINTIDTDQVFTFNGVKDDSRIDSYFDPFGNLSIENRIYVEIARECSKIGDIKKVIEIKNLLLNQISKLQGIQMNAYWEKYLLNMP